MVPRPKTPDGEPLLEQRFPPKSEQDHHEQPQHSHPPPPHPWQIFWWLLTLTFSALILAAIKIYETLGNFPSVQKHMFNAISTALILGLGLNFFGSHHAYALNTYLETNPLQEAFKALAKGSRTKILSRNCYSARERERIENIENLTDVIRLGWESHMKPWAKPWTTLFCITWIMVNILAQISVATISLTYSIVDGKTWNDTYYRPGVANASNLTCYMDSFNAWDGCGGDVTGQALAHAYGEMALSSRCGNYTLTSDILKIKKDYSYYCNRTPNQQQFAYRFNEYNPEDKQKSYPRFTNRTITASAGKCFVYTMVGEPRTESSGTLLYNYTNGTFNSSINIPEQTNAFDGTTYIYRGINTPENAVTYACGPRCIWMWAHKSVGHGEPSTFYQCPITVSPVSNVTNDTQNIPDGMARLAAASIALQGRPSNQGHWNQYQLYTYGSAWEVHLQSPDHVGADMAEFAIGSISTMARTNRQIQVHGSVPCLGSHLEVKWYYLVPLLAGITGTHFVLFLLDVYAL